MTPQVNTDRAEKHKEAVALLEEMAECLRLAPETIRGLAEKVTGRTWEQLDIASAERVVDVLSDLLHRSLARRALIPLDTRPQVLTHVGRTGRNTPQKNGRSMNGKEGMAWL
jgi:hypothetical protein